jgi:hypothetical protein
MGAPMSDYYYEGKTRQEREDRGRQDGRNGVYDATWYAYDNVYREAVDQGRGQRMWDEHLSSQKSFFDSGPSYSSSSYSSYGSSESSGSGAPAEELIKGIFFLAAAAMVIAAIYWTVVVILTIIGHVVEPLVGLVWRPLFAFGALPDNPAYYWATHVVALPAIWIAIFFAFKGRARHVGHYVLFVALTALVLELLRFSSCWAADPLLQKIYRGSGFCQHSLWGFTLQWGTDWRDTIGDVPVLLSAIGIACYGALTTLATAFVTFPGFFVLIAWEQADIEKKNAAAK